MTRILALAVAGLITLAPTAQAQEVATRDPNISTQSTLLLLPTTTLVAGSVAALAVVAAVSSSQSTSSTSSTSSTVRQ